jgi:hypothetical protein
MKKLALLIFACLLWVPASVYARQKLHRITLKDASVIVGKVLEMKDGVYSIESPALGKINLREENIVEIRLMGQNEQYPGNSNTIDIHDGARRNQPSPARQKYEQSLQNQSSGGSDGLNRQQEEVNSRVRSMTADGNFVDSLMDVSGSESMMDVMSDPEVMDAISRNDYEFLMNNEKMKALMESQSIKNLLGDVE